MRAWLATLGALALAGAPAWADDGGVPPDASTAPVRAPPDAGALRIGDQEGELTRRVRRLARLARGEDALNVPIATLFAVDLGDEGAVQARIVALDEQLAEREAFADTSTATEDYAARVGALERRALQLERAFLAQGPDLRRARVQSDAAKHRALVDRAQAEADAELAARAADRAEAEVRKASAEARATRDHAVRALKTRLASVKREQAELARLDEQRALHRERVHGQQLALVKGTRWLVLAAQSSSSTVSPESLHSKIRAALVTSLDALEGGLDALVDPFETPKVDLADLPPVDLEAPEVEAARGELLREAENLISYAASLRAREHEARHVALTGWLEPPEALREALFSTATHLPAAARNRTRSPLQDGLENLRLELRYLELVARGLWHTRVFAMQRLEGTWLEAPGLAWDLARAALVLILFVWVSRRLRGLSAWLDRYQLLTRHTLGWHRRALRVTRNIERFAPSLLYLLGLWLVHELLTHGRRWLDLDLLYLVLWWLGVFWLLRTLLSTLVLWAATRRQLRLDHVVRANVAWSSVVVGWMVFAYGLLHDVFVLVLGRGVIYFFAEGLLYVALAVSAIALLQRWRRTIASAYLSSRPEGRLAELVQAAETRWYGFFVAVAAFGWVLLRAASSLLRDALLSLDEVRKALAFVFRKQLERKAEEVGPHDRPFDRFPEKLRAAFTTAPVEDDGVCVDRFPGLDALAAQLERWQESEEGGTFLLRGRRGYGKSTWLWRATQRFDPILPVTRLDLVRKGGGIFEQLGQRLASESEAAFADLDALQVHLLNGKKRALFVDDFHRLLYRRLGGFEALEALLHLMHSTRRKVFWVVSVDEEAWRFVTAARPHRLRFRAEQRLDPWPEDAIARLLMARAAASGIVHQFEDLVIESDRAQSPEALSRASEAYTRLIWDFAGGNPMVAAHFWLRSLVPITNSRVRVRLFKAPEEELLDALPDDWTFLLGAIAQHETLCPAEASEVLGFPEDTCAAAFEHLRQDGLLEPVPGSHQLTLAVFWRRAVERHLKHRHLL